MDSDTRQKMIARHDALVEEYNRLGDEITPEQNDELLEEIAVLEMLLVG